MIERLQAYRQRLLTAGKLLEARAVGRCIDLVKQHINASPTHEAAEAPRKKVATPR